MKYILFSLILLISTDLSLIAQTKWDMTWLSRSNSKQKRHTRISFNENQIQIDTVIYQYNYQMYGAFISSYQTGELLMYSNGCEVIEAITGQPIKNGIGLNKGTYNHESGCSKIDTIPSPTGSSGWIQDILFIPLDTLDEEFLLVYNQYRNIVEYPYVAIQELASSRIIRNVENKYELTNKDQVLLSNPNLTLASLNLVAIQGAKLAWWLITSDDSTNVNYRIYVSKDSISAPSKLVILQIIPDIANGLSSKISPIGDLYAKVEVPQDSLDNWIYLFDFDRATGELSYNQKWPLPGGLSLSSGLEFSASGRFLYVTNNLYIYQYDLLANDIPGSVELVAEWDGFVELNSVSNFFYPQRGPDCRIYINSSSSLRSYHYINHPEVKGKGCDVRQHALPLIERHAGSIPFFPNYRLDYTCPVCDSTLELPIEVSSEDVPISKAYFKVFPNPFVDVITIRMMVGNVMPESDIVLMDLNGRELIKENAYGRDQFTMDASGLPAGMYILQFRQQGKVIQVDKVVKM